MNRKEIFTNISNIEDEILPSAPLNVALALGFMGSLALFCQSEEILSQLHGAARNYMEILLSTSNERETVERIIEKVPDEKTSDLAIRLLGAVRTRRFQKAVTNGNKPHRVVFEVLLDIAASYERRS